MADKDFVVKNGLVVNSTLIVANSSRVGINTASPDATFSVVGTANVSGNTALGSRLAVTGPTTLSNTIAVTGNASFSNTVTITGAATLSNTLNVTGQVTVNALTANAASFTSFTVTGIPTFSGLSVSGNATFSNTVNMTGANVNVNGTMTVTSANIVSGLVVGNATSFVSVNSSGAGYFTGNVQIIGNLIVTGNTVSSGTTEQAGDFNPSVNNLKLGNTTNRWTLNAVDGNFSNTLAPTANGRPLGNTTLRWNLWANSVDVANSASFNGPFVVTTNSIVFRANSTFNLLTATGDGVSSNIAVGGSDVNITANVNMSGANLFVTGTNTQISSNISVGGTNTTITSNVLFSGANLRITGTNTSVSSNATLSGIVNITGANLNISATNTAIGNVFVTGATVVQSNSQAFRANSTVTNILISGNGSVSNVFVGGDLLTVNAATNLNNTVVVTSNSQTFRSNTSVSALSITGNGTTTNVAVGGTNLSVDANTTIGGTSATISANTTLNGTARFNANVTVASSNLVVQSNSSFTGSVLSSSANVTLSGANVVISGTLTGNAITANTATVTAITSTTQNTVNLTVTGNAAFGTSITVASGQIDIGNTTSNSVQNSTVLAVRTATSSSIQNAAGFFVGNTLITNASIVIGATSINATHYTGNVFWANVSGRPTAISSFTNDLNFANSTNLNNINGSANSASFIGSLSAANVVSNAQLAANLASYMPLTGGTLTGPLIVSNTIAVLSNSGFGANSVFVDATNRRLGVNTAAPSVSFHIAANDAVLMPRGTSAQRPSGANGMFRYNTENAKFEGYANGQWGDLAGSGGAYYKGNLGTVGDPNDKNNLYKINSNTQSNNVTIEAGENAMVAGPITIADGFNLTVDEGGRMVIL